MLLYSLCLCKMNFLLVKLLHCLISSIISKESGSIQGTRIDTGLDPCELFSRNTFLNGKHNMVIWTTLWFHSMIFCGESWGWSFEKLQKGLFFQALVWIWVRVPRPRSSLLLAKEELLYLSTYKERTTGWTNCWSALEIML